MTIIDYPIIYYPIGEDAVWGQLVGSAHQCIDKDIQLVKTNLLRFLQKQYKQENDYPYMKLKNAKLKTIYVEVLPNWKEQGISYPLKKTINVPVPVVYGETEYDQFEFYLPLMSEYGYSYADASQFEYMVKYFALNQLVELTPPELYKYLSFDKAGLETIRLKVNEDKYLDYKNHDEVKTPTLSSMAQAYPAPKSQQKSNNNLADTAWCVDEMIQETITLIQAMRANVLLVGPRSVGKSAILKAAIQKIVGLSKKQHFNIRFWQLIPQRIVAKARYLGEWQENCENIVNEINQVNGILWISDIIKLVEIGGEGAEDSVAAYFQSYLQQGKLQIIGELTVQELEVLRRLLPSFAECFQVLKIEELPEFKVLDILEQHAKYSTQNLKITINQEALQTGYRLLQRYYPYESFPGKGVKLLGRCISEAQSRQRTNIDKAAILQHFTE